MLKCKDCGKEITGKGKTGLCNSCAKKTKNMKRKLDLKCTSCGKPLADWNKTGLCQKCLNDKMAGTRGGTTNVPKQGVRVKAICWNSHCRKEFWARPDQHPRFSLCPTCKELSKTLSRFNRMVQGNNF